MATEKKPMGLADLIIAEFKGPFEMETVPANRKVFPEAMMLIPASEEIGDEIKVALGIESAIICFPVAAFNPPLWREGKCYLRQRRNIIECIPAGWAIMKAPEWAPTPRITTFDLVFAPDGHGRFITKNPLTGQTILPRKEWKLPEPDKDGKIIIPAGQAEIRPTATRTFWIAGECGTLALISEHQMATYDTNGADKPKVNPFAYAEQFRLFDQWYTAFEVLGDPLAGLLIEVDKRSGNAGLAFNLQMIVDRIAKDTGEFQSWMSRELLPLLHPDFLDNRTMSSTTRLKIMDIADMTRNESLRLIKWYEGWVNSILSDFRQRMATGASLKQKIPGIIAESGKKEPRKPRRGRLIDLKRADLEKMLFQPRSKDKPPTEKPVEDKKTQSTAPAAKPVKPPIKTGSTGRKPASTPSFGATVGELLLKNGQGEKLGLKPAEKQLSHLVECNSCKRSHVRPEGFTGKKLKTCPKAGKTTK